MEVREEVRVSDDHVEFSYRPICTKHGNSSVLHESRPALSYVIDLAYHCKPTHSHNE